MKMAINASEMLVAPRISECFGLPWSAKVCLGLHTWDTWDTCILAYLHTCILGILGYLHTCFGLHWSTLICLGLLGLFQIIIERLKCSKAISGWMDGMGLGLGWKSL